MAATTDSDVPTFPIERDPKLRLLIPVIVAIGFGMEGIDTTIITTAIPAMAKSLHSTPLGMSLAVTTYVLVLAVFIPVSGWFADRFGHAGCSPPRSSPSRQARCNAASRSTCRCSWPPGRCRVWAAR